MPEENGAMSAEVMTRPTHGGDVPRPKQGRPRGLLPSTWVGRSLRLAYVGADGAATETSGTLLDWYGTGPVFSLNGAKVLLAWETIRSLELVED